MPKNMDVPGVPPGPPPELDLKVELALAIVPEAERDRARDADGFVRAARIGRAYRGDVMSEALLLLAQVPHSTRHEGRSTRPA